MGSSQSSQDDPKVITVEGDGGDMDITVCHVPDNKLKLYMYVN